MEIYHNICSLIQDLDNSRIFSANDPYYYEVNLPGCTTIIKISQYRNRKDDVIVHIPDLKIEWVTDGSDHNALLLEIHSEIKSRI